MRKMTMVFCVLVLSVIAGAPVFAAQCGDVNNDGTINILDALMLARSYVGVLPETFSVYVADVNGDGQVNIIDALRIVQYYIGLPVTLDCPVQPSETPVPGVIPGTVTVSHISGIQCEITYFNSAAEALAHLQNNGITVYEMKVQSLVVITLCGVPSGTTYIATISETDYEKAKALGWQ